MHAHCYFMGYIVYSCKHLANAKSLFSVMRRKMLRANAYAKCQKKFQAWRKYFSYSSKVWTHCDFDGLLTSHRVLTPLASFMVRVHCKFMVAHWYARFYDAILLYSLHLASVCTRANTWLMYRSYFVQRRKIIHRKENYEEWRQFQFASCVHNCCYAYSLHPQLNEITTKRGKHVDAVRVVVCFIISCTGNQGSNPVFYTQLQTVWIHIEDYI